MRGGLSGILVLAVSAHASAAPGPSAPPPEAPLVVLLGPRASEAEPLALAVEAAARIEGAPFVDLTPLAPSAPAAPRALRAAIEAYEAFRGDEAWARLEEAAVEARATGGAGLGASELAELFLYRALVATQRGDAARAWEEQLRAVTFDPTRVLDPLRFPPRAIEAWTRARAAVDAVPRGRLVVRGLDAACALIVDGRATAAPEIELASGEHLVRGECPDGATWGRSVLLATPRLELDAPATPPRIATPEAALTLAQRRGARTVIVIELQVGAGPPTARLRRLDVPGGGARGRALIALGPDVRADAVTALRTLVTGGVRLPLVPVAPAPAPKASWTRSPWLWAAVGATATALLVLPFTIGGGDDNLDLYLGGATPP